MNKILFICTGNICRSPTADGIMRQLLAQDNMSHIIVDSAALYDYHIGESPDKRTIMTAKERGYDLSNLVARKVEIQDFYDFDLILAMDKGHFNELRKMAPKDAKAKVDLFLKYTGVKGINEVPDPYYGGQQEFDQVFDLIEQGAKLLLNRIKTKNRLLL